MIEQAWTVLCVRSATDKETNNISLFEVLEQIQIFGPNRPPGGTAVLPLTMELITLWERSDWTVPTRGTARAVIRLPDGETQPPIELDVDLTNAPRHRTLMRFSGLPFRDPGVIRFEVFVRVTGTDEGHRVANVPLLVEMAGRATATGSTPR